EIGAVVVEVREVAGRARVADRRPGRGAGRRFTVAARQPDLARAERARAERRVPHLAVRAAPERRDDVERAAQRRPAELDRRAARSEEHTSELQSLTTLVCRL